MKLQLWTIAILVGIGAAAAPVQATTVPFTEDFAVDTADWFSDAAGAAPLVFNASGGPDASSFASTVFNYLNSGPSDTPAFLRAQDEFNSSGNAFFGDWIASGVNQFSMFVKHDAGTPLDFFARFSGPANFPGAVAVIPTSVPSGTWTELVVDISPSNTNIVLEGFPFADVFSNVGHVQIGTFVPSGLLGVDQDVVFGLDQVTIVPEPGTIVLFAMGAALGLRRNRRRLG
ncbi:MAG: PEP-CTERM sorting domain-containing protein [Phycisphaerae bacterium]